MAKKMRRIILRILLLVPATLVLIALLVLAYNLFVPRMSWLRSQNPRTTALMEHRKSQWRAQGLHKDITLRWAGLANISPYLINAVIIAEDDKFWQHGGFDWQAIKEAYERNRARKRVRFGGSTISQQLVKNLFLSSERSILRKVREAVLTWRLERAVSKRRILELYLNLVEWGDGVFGAEAAAGFYYGKHAAELWPDEAARLAAILPQPRRYTPLKIRNSRYLEKRSAEIIEILKKRGVWKPEMEEPIVPLNGEPVLIHEPTSP